MVLQFTVSIFFSLLLILRFQFSSASGQIFHSYQEYEEHLTVIMKKNLESTNMHLCMNLGETFSGSFLITKERLLNKNIAYNLTTAHVEQAVTMMASRKKIMQTLDVLDFSIVNLSTYERLIYRIYEAISDAEMVRESLETMERTLSILKDLALESRAKAAQLVPANRGRDNELNETVVIIPVLLSTMGSSNSKLEHRKRYFEMCFWSFYQFYSNIVIFVMNVDDYNYLK